MTVLKNQLNQPRERGADGNNSVGAYKFYKDSLKKQGKKPAVDYKTHYAIIKRFNEELGKKLIEGKVIELPSGVGKMLVAKHPVSGNLKRKKRIDFGHWRKTGEVREFINEHTDYMKLAVNWVKGNVSNILSYEFETCRTVSRSISKKAQKEGAGDFIEIKRKTFKPKKKKIDDLQFDFE